MRVQTALDGTKDENDINLLTLAQSLDKLVDHFLEDDVLPQELKKVLHFGKVTNR